MPEYNAVIAACNCSHDDISIDDEVVNQLRLFVTEIAMMYRNNPFQVCHLLSLFAPALVFLSLKNVFLLPTQQL